METKELMIGDWVQNTNHDIGKVIGFQYDTYSEHNAIVISYHSNSTCFSGCKLIQPIPLTAEILEKNGYSWAGSGDSTMMLMTSYMEKGVRYNIYVGLAKQTISIYVAVPKFRIRDVRKTNRVLLEDCGCYVHELQHALRLCGLNDLADNFIV